MAWGRMVTRQPPQNAVGAHRRHRDAAAGLADALVVGQQRGREILARVVPLDRARRSAPARRRASFLRTMASSWLPLLLTGLEAHLGLADLAAESLLQLHEAEDLFLGLGLLLLGFLDLEQGGRVLLVGLHLVEARLLLGALGGDDLEVLLLGAQVLAGGVDLDLEGLQPSSSPRPARPGSPRSAWAAASPPPRAQRCGRRTPGARSVSGAENPHSLRS